MKIEIKKKKAKKTKKKIKNIKFGGYKLPTTMDITKWGPYQFIFDNKTIIYKPSSLLEYHIELFDNYQLIELKLNDKVLLTFKDTMNDKSNLSTFTRIVKNHKYIFEDGELILKKIKKKVSFLSKIKRNMNNSKNFITMDLETRVINEIMSSYCVSIYEGKEFKSFYLTDYLSSNAANTENIRLAEKNMLRDSISYLM